jgi:hypothetical protein
MIVYILGFLSGTGIGFTACMWRWNVCEKRDQAFRSEHADRILKLLDEK